MNTLARSSSHSQIIFLQKAGETHIQLVTETMVILTKNLKDYTHLIHSVSMQSQPTVTNGVNIVNEQKLVHSRTAPQQSDGNSAQQILYYVLRTQLLKRLQISQFFIQRHSRSLFITGREYTPQMSRDCQSHYVHHAVTVLLQREKLRESITVDTKAQLNIIHYT